MRPLSYLRTHGPATLLATVCLPALCLADVHVEVVANPTFAVAGEYLDVEITVSNDGSSDLFDLTTLLDFPAGIAGLSNSSFDGGCAGTGCSTGEQASFFLPLLRAGEGHTFNIPPQVVSNAPTGLMIPFAAQVFDDGLEVAQSTDWVTVDNERVLQVALDERQDPVAPGGFLDLRLSYGVQGNSTGAQAAALSFPLPAGTSFVSAEDGGTLAGGVVTWELGNLDPGDSGVRDLRIRVVGNRPLGSLLVGEAFFQDQGNQAAISRSTVRVEQSPALDLIVTTGPGGARNSELIDIDVTVSNSSSLDRSGVVLRLKYPAGLTGISNSLTPFNCGGTGCSVQEYATVSVGTLRAGEGRNFSIPARMGGSTLDGSLVRLEAFASDASGELVETATAIAVDAQKDFQLALVADKNPAVPGDTVSYTLTYGLLDTGLGQPDATLRFDLPEGAIYQSSDLGGTLMGETVEWSLGSLNPGDSGTRQVILQVAGNQGLGTQLVAQATLEGTGGGKPRVRHEVATRVQEPETLQLTVTAGPELALPGEILDVELTVSNAGSLQRSDVVVRLEYPDGLNGLSNSLFTGNCTGTGCSAQEYAVFVVGDLAPGEGRTFSMPISALSSLAGGSVVRLEAEAGDATGFSREAQTAFAVDPMQSLDLSLIADADPVAAGALLSYTLTYGVFETSSGLPAGVLRLPLPEGTQLVDVNGGGVLMGNVVEWSLGGVDPGASGQVRVTAVVDANVPQGTQLVTEASFEGAGATPVRYPHVTRVQSGSPLQLVVSANPDPAQPGEYVDFELTVSNDGLFDRTGLQLRLEVPTGLDSISNSVILGGNCPGTACEAVETLIFPVDVLRAGEGRVFSVPFRVSGAAVSGRVIAFEAELTDSSGDRRCAAANLAVDDMPGMNLTLLENRDAIVPGSLVKYRMVYGVDATTAGANDAQLVFEVPVGSEVAALSDDGLLQGRTITWPLGSLSPGNGGERTVTLQAGPNLMPGSILAPRANITGSQVCEIRSRATTRVLNEAPLRVSVSVQSQPALPGSPLDVRLKVRNTSAFDRADVLVTLEYPAGLNGLSNGSFPGSCAGTGCTTQENAVFFEPILLAGETKVYSLPPSVASSVLLGSIIRFDAFGSDASGSSAAGSAALLVGNGFDGAADNGARRPLQQ